MAHWGVSDVQRNKDELIVQSHFLHIGRFVASTLLQGVFMVMVYSLMGLLRIPGFARRVS